MIKKKNLSAEDKKAWENFTKYPSDIYDKEKNNAKFNHIKNVLSMIFMVLL